MRALRYLAPALAALLLTAAAQPARANDQPTGIRVRGQGVITARPDVAFLGIGASVRRDTAGAAFDQAESLVAALTDSLKANGVAERDIQTRQFTLSPEFGRSTDNNPPPITGWRAVHTLSVKLRDFSRIGRTIDDGVGALGGEAVLQGISFAIEDTDALAARARATAIANARSKAEETAAAAGVRLGAITAIQEVSSPPPTPVRSAEAPLRAPAAAPTGAQSVAAEIAPGELTVSVIVDVIFAIE